MRAILLILILAVVILIVAIATGFLDINQVRGAKAPDIDASRNGVTATGGTPCNAPPGGRRLLQTEAV